MNRGVRRILPMVVAAGLLLAATLATAGPAAAAKGGNNENAQACHKGGWDELYRSDGTEFDGQKACTTYGAKGGTLLTQPPTQPPLNAFQQWCATNGVNGTPTPNTQEPTDTREFVDYPCAGVQGAEYEPAIMACQSVPFVWAATYSPSTETFTCTVELP